MTARICPSPHKDIIYVCSRCPGFLALETSQLSDRAYLASSDLKISSDDDLTKSLRGEFRVEVALLQGSAVARLSAQSCSVAAENDAELLLTPPPSIPPAEDSCSSLPPSVGQSTCHQDVLRGREVVEPLLDLLPNFQMDNAEPMNSSAVIDIQSKADRQQQGWCDKTLMVQKPIERNHLYGQDEDNIMKPSSGHDAAEEVHRDVPASEADSHNLIGCIFPENSNQECFQYDVETQQSQFDHRSYPPFRPPMERKYFTLSGVSPDSLQQRDKPSNQPGAGMQFPDHGPHADVQMHASNEADTLFILPQNQQSVGFVSFSSGGGYRPLAVDLAKALPSNHSGEFVSGYEHNFEKSIQLQSDPPTSSNLQASKTHAQACMSDVADISWACQLLGPGAENSMEVGHGDHAGELHVPVEGHTGDDAQHFLHSLVHARKDHGDPVSNSKTTAYPGGNAMVGGLDPNKDRIAGEHHMEGSVSVDVEVDGLEAAGPPGLGLGSNVMRFDEGSACMLRTGLLTAEEEQSAGSRALFEQAEEKVGGNSDMVVPGVQTEERSKASVRRSTLNGAERSSGGMEHTLMTGFQTAAGTKTTVSKAYLEQAEMRFGMADDVVMSVFQTGASNKAPERIGRCSNRVQMPEAQTAAGGNDAVRRDTLEQGERMFEDACFQKGAGNIVLGSGAALEQAGRRFGLADDVAMSGFQTAAGNKASVTRAALQQAERMFGEAAADDFSMPGFQEGESKVGGIEDVPMRGFQTADGGKATVSRASIERAKRLLGGSEDVVMSGFQTGTGNKASVSRAALQQAEKRFGESDDVAMSGFQTGAGDKVPSSRAPQESDRRFGGSDSVEFMTGFMTAAGSKPTVSKASLEQAQRLFDASDDVVVPGYQMAPNTATSDRVGLPPVRLRYGGELEGAAEGFLDAARPRTPADTGRLSRDKETVDMVGFQTAAGNRASVSRASLERYAAMAIDDAAADADPGENVGGEDFRQEMEELQREKLKRDTLSRERKRPRLSGPGEFPRPSPLLRQAIVQDGSRRLSSRSAGGGGFVTPLSTGNLNQSSEGGLSASVPIKNLYNEFDICSPIRPPATTAHPSGFGLVPFSARAPSPPTGDNTPTHIRPLSLEEARSSYDSPIPFSARAKSDSLRRKSFGVMPPRTPLPGGSGSRKFIPPGRSSTPTTTARSQRPPSLLSPAPIKPFKTHKSVFDLTARQERLRLSDFVDQACPTAMGRSEYELLQYGVHPRIIHMNSLLAKDYRFTYGFNGAPPLAASEELGVEGMMAAMIAHGADSDLLTHDWVANHYRWIVWKLASMERAFPDRFAKSKLTPDAVLSQLLYRYEREINQAKRSALKRICERDDAASRHLVLMVASITKIEEQGVANVDAQETPARVESTRVTQRRDSMGNSRRRSSGGNERCVRVELSDGWYSLDAQLDPALSAHVISGKIYCGMKLRIWGAEFEGEDCGPLDAAARRTVMKLHINGTRRAHWDVKLGFQKQRPFLVHLATVQGGGGLIPALRLRVQRQYPPVFSETLPNGTTIRRSVQADDVARRRDENKKQQAAEERSARMLQAQAINHVEGKAGVRAGGASRGRKGSLPIEELSDGEDIEERLSNAENPREVYERLSARQRQKLDTYNEEKMRGNMESMEKDSMPVREVLCRVQLLVTDLTTKRASGAADTHTTARITLFQTSEELLKQLTEGSAVTVYGLKAKDGSRPLQLYAPSSTVFRAMPEERCNAIGASGLELEEFTVRSAVNIDGLSYFKGGDEFDLVGVFLLIGDDPSTVDLHLQVPVMLTDASERILIVQCPSEVAVDMKAIKSFSIMSFINLTYVSYDGRYNAYVARASEVSLWSTNIRTQYLIAAKAALESPPGLRLSMEERFARPLTFARCILNNEPYPDVEQQPQPQQQQSEHSHSAPSESGLRASLTDSLKPTTFIGFIKAIALFRQIDSASEMESMKLFAKATVDDGQGQANIVAELDSDRVLDVLACITMDTEMAPSHKRLIRWIQELLLAGSCHAIEREGDDDDGGKGESVQVRRDLAHSRLYWLAMHHLDRFTSPDKVLQVVLCNAHVLVLPLPPELSEILSRVSNSSENAFSHIPSLTLGEAVDEIAALSASDLGLLFSPCEWAYFLEIFQATFASQKWQMDGPAGGSRQPKDMRLILSWGDEWYDSANKAISHADVWHIQAEDEMLSLTQPF